MSWYHAPLLDLRPDITSCRNVPVWNLRSCIYWAPSLTTARVCNLQCNHSMVRVAQNPKPYPTVSSETPPTWSWSRSHFTTQSQSVCLGIEHPCGTCDQILLPVGRLLSDTCGLVSVGRPLWREDGSEICSVITQWSESLRTRNPSLEGQVPVFISPRNRVAQLYPRALGFVQRIFLKDRIRYVKHLTYIPSVSSLKQLQ
jgi:hypothetical protein